MTAHFVIPMKPVGVNERYQRAGFSRARGSGGGKGLILSEKARVFNECAQIYAMVSARVFNWPEPARVSRVGVTIKVWNTKHDIDAPIKGTLDAMEGIFYSNDRAVRRLLVEEPSSDGGSPRIEVSVTTLLP